MPEDREISGTVFWEYYLEDDDGDRVYVEDTATTPQSRLEEFEERYAVQYRPARLRDGPLGRPDDTEVTTTESYDDAVAATDAFFEEL